MAETSELGLRNILKILKMERKNTSQDPAVRASLPRVTPPGPRWGVLLSRLPGSPLRKPGKECHPILCSHQTKQEAACLLQAP